VQAHYETPAQQAHRLAVEQQRATVISIGTIHSSIVNIQVELSVAPNSYTST